MGILLKGSPPQVRGKLWIHAEFTVKRRITPAGAGKTYLVMALVDITSGSPPQVRGKLIAAIVAALPQRITPAGAGKTSLKPASTLSKVDHPRRCGENIPQLVDAGMQLGSPPQVRGKPVGTRLVTPLTRITPAGAGKTKTMALLWVKS